MKPDINRKMEREKSTNMQKQSNTLQNNQWVKAIKMKIKEYLKPFENRNTNDQNLWDTAKAVLRESLQWQNVYIKKLEISQIKNLKLYFKELIKLEQSKLKVRKRRKQ